jgi:tetraacyldisaccharide 4'-kinase
MKSLQYYWYRSSIFLWLLLPVSWLYCLIVFVRRKLYQLNIKRSYDCELPVIVIGNISVGGTGKTPLLISLCSYLKEKGYRPGVVSRGYGGEFSGIKQVSDADTAKSVGDEPLMIYNKTSVPVVVSADRVAAVRYLASNNQCDVVLSDDGLQHYRMRRSFEIAVVDSVRRFGNGFCLPAGPLRERPSRLDDVNMLIYNGNTGISSGDCSYQLDVEGLQRLGGDEKKELGSFAGQSVHAVAGIGYPMKFFNQLRDSGITVIEHPYPDHHSYCQDDFAGWSDECIIMTDKDAVKCCQLSLSDAWVLSVTAIFSSELESSLSSELLPILNKQTAHAGPIA